VAARCREAEQGKHADWTSTDALVYGCGLQPQAAAGKGKGFTVGMAADNLPPGYHRAPAAQIAERRLQSSSGRVKVGADILYLHPGAGDSSATNRQ